METGRRLSWLEQQDLEYWESIHPFDRLSVAQEKWGPHWAHHIAMLYWERRGPVNVAMATHL